MALAAIPGLPKIAARVVEASAFLSSVLIESIPIGLPFGRFHRDVLPRIFRFRIGLVQRGQHFDQFAMAEQDVHPGRAVAERLHATAGFRAQLQTDHGIVVLRIALGG